jgi:DNA invertase Pin-like site-specific DNA recombinase
MTKITRINPPVLPMMEKKRVAAYARVSVDYDKNLESLYTQIRYYNSLIQKNFNWEFAGVYSDEGITGTKVDRPGFQELIKQCEIGNVDMIITKSISRFTRNTVDLLDTVRSLKEKGINVYFERENINTNSTDGEFLLTLLASIAQE